MSNHMTRSYNIIMFLINKPFRNIELVFLKTKCVSHDQQVIPSIFLTSLHVIGIYIFFFSSQSDC